MDYLLGSKKSWVLKESIDEHFNVTTSRGHGGKILKIEPKCLKHGIKGEKDSKEEARWSTRDEIDDSNKYQNIKIGPKVVIKVEPVYLELRPVKVEPSDDVSSVLHPKVESVNTHEAGVKVKTEPPVIKTEETRNEEIDGPNDEGPCQGDQPIAKTTRNIELMKMLSASGESKVIVSDAVIKNNYMIHKVCDLKEVIRRKNRDYCRDSILMRGLKDYPPVKGDGKLSYLLSVKKLRVVKGHPSPPNGKGRTRLGVAFECILCHQAYPKEIVLKRHLVYHKNKGRYQCTQCSWSFSSSGDLGSHMRSHTFEKPHRCKICGKQFSQAGNLRTHMNYHNEKRLFPCKDCDQSFFAKSHLIRHVLSVHTKEKDRPFECSVCGKRCPTQDWLDKHFRTHTAEKPYSCPQCNKKFSLKGHMRRHFKIHTGEREFECKECKKAFRTIDDLRRHAIVHDDSVERKYKCDQCDATFKCKGGLRAHVRIHTGDKPHKCEECDMRFMVQSRLNRHVRDVHESTGERPFECDKCSRTYTKAIHLKNHQLVHSGVRPHKCDICGGSFVYRGVLKTHLKQVHKITNVKEKVGKL